MPLSTARKYSTKVQQPAGTQAARPALTGTVACTDALGWMPCLLMACKRSGVRIPIAPHKRPGQMGFWDRLAHLPRSLDRHLTAVLGIVVEQSAIRIGTRRQAGLAG